MSNKEFLQTTLALAASVIIPTGLVVLLMQIRSVKSVAQRLGLVRWSLILGFGLVTFVVSAALLPLNMLIPDFLFSGIGGNRWDYSALAASGANCPYDTVTCIYMTPTPPIGVSDPDMPGNGPLLLIVMPVFAAVLCGFTIWRETGADQLSRRSHANPVRVEAASLHD